MCGRSLKSSRLVRLSLILSAAIIAPPFTQEIQGAESKIIARAEAVQRPAIVDCNRIKAPAKSRPTLPRRASDSLGQVGAPIKLNDESAPSQLTAGVWSPNGDSIAFVAPTGRFNPLKIDEADKRNSGNAPTRAIARSINEIWVYHFPDKKWNKVADDGARPRFSEDGKRLLYVSSQGARAIDMATLADEALGTPEAGDPHKRFQIEVLSDGSVLLPGQSDGVLKQKGTLHSSWAAIELAPDDEIRIAPNEERIAVIYNANEKNPTSALVVYDKAGTATTVLKNCPGSMVHLAWSQDGESVLYPMRATGQPEVWETRLSGGAPQARVRLQSSERIGALSLSPDNRYVTFSQTSYTDKEWIWIANGSERQRIASGLLGDWSRQGDRILYAVRRSGGGLDWYVVPVRLQGQ
jgi:dipeptidyl aminopeptidase/acylaminoacyl peptidase